MRKVTWCLSGLLSTSLAVAQEEISVRVCNTLRIPEATLANAEKEASFVLGGAGLAVKWLDCSTATMEPELGARDFVLTVSAFRPDPKEGRLHKQTMGLVDRGMNGNHLTIYYSAVAAFVNECGHGQEAEIDTVLGYAIAHEFGHLFMGTKHTPEGVMRPVWEKQNVDQMRRHAVRFSTGERLRVQSNLLARDRVWN